ALELVARIGNHAIFRRHHRGPLRHGEIDAVIVAAVRPGSEGRHDAALHRPPETIAGHRIWRGKLLVGGDTRRAHSWSAWTRGLVRCRDRSRRRVLLLAGFIIGALSLGAVRFTRLLRLLFGERGAWRRNPSRLHHVHVRLILGRRSLLGNGRRRRQRSAPDHRLGLRLAWPRIGGLLDARARRRRIGVAGTWAIGRWRQGGA